MGDRGNIGIEFHDGSRVYLYTHWGGSVLQETLAEVLATEPAQRRIGDPAYLARIVFEYMLRDASDKETGFGISTGIEDNEHPILVVKVDGSVIEEPA